MRRLVARTHLTLLLAAMLLVPLGGAAAGGTIHHASKLSCATRDGAAARSAFGSVGTLCYVDQYGNSYSFHKDTTDPQGNYLIGTATNAQGCSTSWYIEGSFVQQGGVKLQLTVINPLGDNDPGCVGSYTLKGTFPNMSWYYTYGYGAQSFTFVACADATKPAHPITHGGARRS